LSFFAWSKLYDSGYKKKRLCNNAQPRILIYAKKIKWKIFNRFLCYTFKHSLTILEIIPNERLFLASWVLKIYGFSKLDSKLLVRCFLGKKKREQENEIQIHYSCSIYSVLTLKCDLITPFQHLHSQLLSKKDLEHYCND